MNRKGITLTEVVIVIAILGIIAVLVPNLIRGVYQFFYLHSAKVEIQRDARASLSEINRFLRQAVSTSVTIDQASNQPPWSRIKFTTVTGQQIQFFQNGNSLYEVASSSTVISRNCRYIAFTYPRTDDPTILSVSLTMEKATYNGGSKALELSVEKVRVMN